MSDEPRIAFGGDRDISVWVLEYLLSQQVRPRALFVSAPRRATHAEQLIALCPFLEPEDVFRGKAFRREENLERLRRLDLDYIINVHFPYIVPQDVLAIPRLGVLNLHPAYLPFNRGWHTPSWALLDDTPIGATLHFMDEGIDTGDIVARRRIEPSPGDTATTLYSRLKQAELELFKETWPRLAAGTHERLAQPTDEGSAHARKDLFAEEVQRIDLDQSVRAVELLRRLRALTTNDVAEAAYYEVDGRRYRVRVAVHEEDAENPTS
jgi:methionyl-tRNA formyltransferase